MKNMKVSAKLILSFVIVIIVTIIIGIIGCVGMNFLNNSADIIYNSNVMAIEAMGNLRELFANERNDLRNIFLNRDNSETVKNTVNKFVEYEKIAKNNFEQYEKTIDNDEDEEAYYKAKDAYTGQYAEMKEEIFDLVEQGAFDEAYQKFTGGTSVIAPITEGFTKSAEDNNNWAAENNEDGNELFKFLFLILVIAIVASVAAAMFLAIYISKIISKPLRIMTAFLDKAGSTGDIKLNKEEDELFKVYSSIRDEIGKSIDSCMKFINRLNKVSDSLEVVASGDLTTELALLSENDIMGVSLKKMVDNLNNMFGEINNSTAQVSDGSKQIADGAQALAQGSTEQASSIQQLSASITDVSEKTNKNAEMAKQAASLANIIKDNAEKGSGQMENMMQAVKEINDASQRINNVIKVIDDIAFQTNILALNAAVEAARAGQHGKGFAVVAEEVRNLAAKSAEAAKDTGVLISNSMEKAQLGAKIAEETSSSLAEIVSGINESSIVVGDIAESSENQSVAIAEINTGISQVAMVVQQNSATSEQSAAAAEEMSSQASILANLAAQFKLKENKNSILSFSNPENENRQIKLTMGESSYSKY